MTMAMTRTMTNKHNKNDIKTEDDNTSKNKIIIGTWNITQIRGKDIELTQEWITMKFNYWALVKQKRQT